MSVEFEYTTDKSGHTLWYQTLVDSKKGDCGRSCVATILQVHPSGIRNYVDKAVCGEEHWAVVLLREVSQYGYASYWVPAVQKPRSETPTGWLLAVVPSLSFEEGLHAVVVDSDYNLVHDPNRLTPRTSLKSSDILYFCEFVKENK